MNYQEFKKLVNEQSARNWGGSNLWEQSKGLFERWIKRIDNNIDNNYGKVLCDYLETIIRYCESLKDVENMYCALRYTNPLVFQCFDIREDKCKISK